METTVDNFTKDQINQLICEFMGEKWPDSKILNPDYSSMPLLWEVVEKILEYEFPEGDNAYLRTFGMVDENGHYMVRINRFGLHHDAKLIRALWKAVADFVIWHTFKDG